jgi:hypothetical protein
LRASAISGAGSRKPAEIVETGSTTDFAPLARHEQFGSNLRLKIGKSITNLAEDADGRTRRPAHEASLPAIQAGQMRQLHDRENLSMEIVFDEAPYTKKGAEWFIESPVWTSARNY